MLSVLLTARIPFQTSRKLLLLSGGEPVMKKTPLMLGERGPPAKMLEAVI